MKQPNHPNPIDIHVGRRIKFARSLSKLSQSDLGEKVGTTFQQIQKYESGINRVSASRLWQMSKVFDVSISFFYKGLENEEKQDNGDLELTARELKIVHDLRQISDNTLRQQMALMIKNLGVAQHA